MRKLEERDLGYAASVLAAVSWGVAGVLVVLAALPPLVLTLFRLWIGVVVLFSILYASGHRVTWRTLRGSLLGGLCLAADMAFFFSALKYTSIVDASVLSALQPVLVLIAARLLFGERISKADFLWVVLAMLGVCVTVLGGTGGAKDRALGDLFALASVIAWSAYWLVSKHASTEHGALEYTSGVTLVAACVMVPVIAIARQPVGLYEPRNWFWVCLLALVPGSAHLLMNWAHRHLDASISSVIGATNPVYAAVAARLVLDQPLTPLQVVGGCIGIGAVAVLISRHGPSLEAQSG